MTDTAPITPPGASLRAAAPWLAAVVLAALLFGCFRVSDPDAFWHLRTGQVILETARPVRTNLFSAFYPDYPWHNTEWLFEVALAGAYNLGGWAGVAALKLAVFAATAAVVFLTLFGASGAAPLAAVVTTVVLALLRYRVTERPQLFSLLLLALVIGAVERDARRGGRAIWALPALFALWSNVHPELVLGLGYLALRLLGGGLDALRGAGPAPGALRRQAAVLALSALATLANPEGWHALLAPLALLRDPALPQVTEFRRTTLAGNPLFWALLAAAAALVPARRELRRFSVVLPLAAFGVVGAAVSRGPTAFALAAAPVLCAGLAPLAAGRPRRLVAAGAAAAVLLVAGATLKFDRRYNYHWGYGTIPQMLPEAAASFILAQNLPPNLYNHYNDGGYLIYRLYPRLRVFQDGHNTVPPEFNEKLGRLHVTGFGALHEQFGVNTALIRTEEYGLFFPPEDWGLVFWDDTYAVLLRRSPEQARLLSRLAYRAYLPGRALPTDRFGLGLAVGEMRRNQRERASPSWRLAIDTGSALMRLKDFAGAEREMAYAAAIAPREPEPWAYLSMVRSLLGKRADAAAALAEARRLDPAGARIRDVVGP